MNENDTAAVLPASVDLPAGEVSASEVGETIETVYVEVVDDRFFMTTPIDDYSVTEGLLLLILLILVLQVVIRFVKGAFWWL